MKKGLIALFIAAILIATGNYANGNNQTQQVLYSIDKLDGVYYEHQEWHELTLEGDLVTYLKRVSESMAFITFDLSQIDLSRAKEVRLKLHELSQGHNRLAIIFWQINDADYSQWTTCSVTEVAVSKPATHEFYTQISHHEPQGCGFREEIEGGTWYEPIRYEPIGKIKNLKKYGKTNWGSGNLLKLLQHDFNGKKYVTIQIINPSDEILALADGNYENGANRPQLIVTY